MDNCKQIEQDNFCRDKGAFEYVLGNPRGRHFVAMLLGLESTNRTGFNLDARIEAFILGRQSIMHDVLNKIKFFNIDHLLQKLEVEQKQLLDNLAHQKEKENDYE